MIQIILVIGFFEVAIKAIHIGWGLGATPSVPVPPTNQIRSLTKRITKGHVDGNAKIIDLHAARIAIAELSEAVQATKLALTEPVACAH